jgi:hypothetical protein
MLRFSILAAVCLLTVLVGTGAAGAQSSPVLRVLFVGNSLTTTNDLPAVVSGLATTVGRRLEVGRVTSDGFALDDHWNDGRIQRELAFGSWDVVIMQQGPSALPESQISLRESATRLSDAVRAVGSRPGLLTVWPESYRRQVLPDVITSYRAAAAAAGADVYPAGDAWFAAWRCDPKLAFYGPDGFHPSRLGTYVAALVVVGKLFRVPLIRRDLALPGMSAKIAARLQAAAAIGLGRRVPRALRC